MRRCVGAEVPSCGAADVDVGCKIEKIEGTYRRRRRGGGRAGVVER